MSSPSQQPQPAPQTVEQKQTVVIKTDKFFEAGFGRYLQNSNFFDVILHHLPSKKEYKCHRLVLAYKSLFFEMLFCSRFLESKSERVLINFEDPDDVFGNVLEYLYKGETTLEPQKVVSFRVAADQLMCSDLSEAVLNYLDKNLDNKSVFPILLKALKVNDDLVVEKTVDYIAREFSQLFEEFKQYVDLLPPYVFFAVLANENLSKKTSDAKDKGKLVSQIVRSYMEKHKIMQDVSLLTILIDSLLASDSLTAEDATMFLVECEKHSLRDQASGCAKVIASNFFQFLGSNNDFIFRLTPYSFIQMIRSDELFIKSEDQVYTVACEYVNRNPEIEDTEKQDIMDSVRYTYLSIPKLKEIRNNPSKFISKREILQALLARVGRIEGDDSYRDLKSLKHNLRPRSTCVFNYASDFDTNGIMYWLGTRYGTEAYKNPLDQGLIDVTHSSNLEAGTKQALIGRDAVSCNLVNQVNSSVAVEFKTITILPTKYSLRHTNARDGECLRNWKLQGSKDGKQWIDIKDHVNDMSLNTKGATASWDIDHEKVNDYFCMLRILQTGPNSSNNDYLSMSGFEVYGLVRRLVSDVKTPVV